MSIDLSSLPTDVNNVSNLVMVNPSKNIGLQPMPIADYNQQTAGLPKPTSVTQALGGALLNFRPVQPTSFLFHILSEESVTLSSDITDHYTEANSALQDHISLKPETVTVSGFIGELNDVAPVGLDLLKSAADKLTSLGPYLPVISSSAIIAYNNAAQIYAAAINAKNSAVSVFSGVGLGSTTNTLVQTEQQKAFVQLKAYWETRTLFRVQTPWAIFDSMAIMSLKATQNEDTRMITDFEITFKKIRFTNQIVSTEKPKVVAGHAAASASAEKDLGDKQPSKFVQQRTG